MCLMGYYAKKDELEIEVERIGAYYTTLIYIGIYIHACPGCISCDAISCHLCDHFGNFRCLCTVFLGEELAARSRKIGSIVDPALEMRLLAYAKGQLPRRVSARDITEEAGRLGAIAAGGYNHKQAMLFLERHAADLGPPEVIML